MSSRIIFNLIEMASRHTLNAKLDGLFTFQILCTIFFRVLLRGDKHRHFLHNNDFETRSTLRGSRDLLSCVRK